MKKLCLFFLAILFIAGIAQAVSIPQTEDAENGPAIWYVPVYNNASATVSKGDVVVWEISSSTGDDDNYITTTTTADTFLVAGVIWPSDIRAGERGTMAVRGVVDVNLSTGSGADTNSLLCTTTTAGKATTCSDTSSDIDSFGHATAQKTSAGTIKAFISR